jgi:hypothetical protein
VNPPPGIDINPDLVMNNDIALEADHLAQVGNRGHPSLAKAVVALAQIVGEFTEQCLATRPQLVNLCANLPSFEDPPLIRPAFFILQCLSFGLKKGSIFDQFFPSLHTIQHFAFKAIHVFSALLQLPLHGLKINHFTAFQELCSPVPTNDVPIQVLLDLGFFLDGGGQGFRCFFHGIAVGDDTNVQLTDHCLECCGARSDRVHLVVKPPQSGNENKI